MQRFIVRLSSPIDKAELERSWHSDPILGDEPRVESTGLGSPCRAVFIATLRMIVRLPPRSCAAA